MLPRQPINVVIAKNKKHLTKAEIKERQRTELPPVDGEIIPPSYLTAKQKQEFNTYVAQLRQLKIIGVTDTDALARYVVANTFYVNSVKQLRSKEAMADPEIFESWMRINERYFKQCREAATDLGLTISSRCRLVVPNVGQEAPKNKFAKFEKRGNSA